MQAPSPGASTACLLGPQQDTAIASGADVVLTPVPPTAIAPGPGLTARDEYMRMQQWAFEIGRLMQSQAEAEQQAVHASAVPLPPPVSAGASGGADDSGTAAGTGALPKAALPKVRLNSKREQRGARGRAC